MSRRAAKKPAHWTVETWLYTIARWGGGTKWRKHEGRAEYRRLASTPCKPGHGPYRLVAPDGTVVAVTGEPDPSVPSGLQMFTGCDFPTTIEVSVPARVHMRFGGRCELPD